MKGLHMVTFLLLVVGGLNWLLVGAFEFDLVATILGDMSVWAKIVYVLVGVSALFELATHKKSCKMCSGKVKEEMPKQEEMPSSTPEDTQM